TNGLLRNVEAETLRIASDLRNLLVHWETRPNDYPAVPSDPLLERLRAIAARLAKPITAIPTFRRKVMTVSSSQSLADVLKRIRDLDFSQFPVYDGSSQFLGLLTENGITRWLAEHVTTEITLIELADIEVARVLRKESAKKENHRFVAADTSVQQVRRLFATEELLEAILFTQHGRRSEPLLGIATRWDMRQVALDD